MFYIGNTKMVSIIFDGDMGLTLEPLILNAWNLSKVKK